MEIPRRCIDELRVDAHEIVVDHRAGPYVINIRPTAHIEHIVLDDGTVATCKHGDVISGIVVHCVVVDSGISRGAFRDSDALVVTPHEIVVCGIPIPGTEDDARTAVDQPIAEDSVVLNGVIVCRLTRIAVVDVYAITAIMVDR